MKGTIYKIEGGGMTYYGSTTVGIKRRFGEHKSKKNKTKSRLIFEMCDNPTYEILEEVEVDTIKELRRIEGTYILKNDCVNKVVAGRTPAEYEYTEKRLAYRHTYRRTEEYRQRSREKQSTDRAKEVKRLWNEKNKEKMRVLRKLNYEKNKEKMKTYNKLYYEKNKEKHKLYYEKNKDKIKQRNKENREKKQREK